MDVFTQMDLHREEYTPREQEIYELFRNHPSEVGGATSTDIARRFGIPQSAISRFCKKIGYSGYGDFRMNMMFSGMTVSQKGERGASDDTADILSSYAYAVRDAMSDEELDRLAKLILHAEHVYTVGEAASSFPAQFLAFNLMGNALPGHFITTGWEQETLRCMTSRDLVVVFSSKNPTQEKFLTLLRELNPARQPYVVLVTHSANHPLSSLVDDKVLLPLTTDAAQFMVPDLSISMIFFCYSVTNAVVRALDKTDE